MNWNAIPDRHLVTDVLLLGTVSQRLRYQWGLALANFKVLHPLAARRLFILRAILSRR